VALAGLVRQAFDLFGNDGEPLARIAGARCLNRGIQRKKIGLLGNVGDELNHRPDFLRRRLQALHLPVGHRGLFGSLGQIRRRFTDLAADFLDRTDKFL
jgi:hypothetical protein